MQQGGMKACPECGNVSDSGAPMCGACGYNFETGKSAERTRIDPTKVPRILADETLPPSRSSSSGKGAGVIVALVALVIFGAVGFIILRVANTVESANERIDQVEFPDINVPTSGPFKERTFTRASCTREVGRAVERLLRAQAEGQVPNDFFSEFTKFGISSFEYRTTLEAYSDFRTQTLLVEGHVGKAVKSARKDVAAACRSEYAG